MLGLKCFGLSQSSSDLIQTLCTNSSFFTEGPMGGGTGQCSGVAPDEKEAAWAGSAEG